MPALALLTAVGLAALALAQATPPTEPARCIVTGPKKNAVDGMGRPLNCGTQGYLRNPSVVDNAPSYNATSAFSCEQACLAYDACESWGYYAARKRFQCQLFDKPLVQQGYPERLRNQDTGNVFYNRKCYEETCTCPTAGTDLLQGKNGGFESNSLQYWSTTLDRGTHPSRNTGVFATCATETGHFPGGSCAASFNTTNPSATFSPSISPTCPSAQSYTLNLSVGQEEDSSPGSVPTDASLYQVEVTVDGQIVLQEPVCSVATPCKPPKKFNEQNYFRSISITGTTNSQRPKVIIMFSIAQRPVDANGDPVNSQAFLDRVQFIVSPTD